MTSRPVCLLVVGCHRSRTSLVAQLLRAAGVDFGDHLMPPSPHNPDGYFEDTRVVRVHDELLAGLGLDWASTRALPTGWLATGAAFDAQRHIEGLLHDQLHPWRGYPHHLWGVKDPRASRFVPLWGHACEAQGIELRVLQVLRDRNAVAASLARREGGTPKRWAPLVDVHVVDARWGAHPYRSTELHTEDLFEKGWRGALRHALDDLGLVSLDVRSLPETIIKPELSHHG